MPARQPAAANRRPQRVQRRQLPGCSRTWSAGATTSNSLARSTSLLRAADLPPGATSRSPGSALLHADAGSEPAKSSPSARETHAWVIAGGGVRSLAALQSDRPELERLMGRERDLAQ